jgi:hypothetical protein
MAGREHLHHDDVPATLAILADLLDHRSTLPDGYELTEHGAWVDWEALGRSWLSSTEVAAVHIARGCAIAERHGGLPLSVAGAVREAVEEMTGWWAVTPDPNALDRFGVEAQGFVEPVGLDPYHPDQPGDTDEPGADSRVEQWREGPAWSHRRPARHRRSAEPSAAPEPGWGPDL